MTTYNVIYEKADDGSWSACAADLPVFSAGATREEAESEVREGIRIYLDFLEEIGETVPNGPSSVGQVTV